MAGLPYETDTRGFGRAPKGKLPYIDDDGRVVADSTFIRLHLEQRYGIEFDKGLSPAERGIAWAFEKMCEDHLYWVAIFERWMNDANFDKGPRRFFDRVPGLLRPLIIAKVRRDVKRNLWGHGLGRHSQAEITELGQRAVAAIADFLGDKPYLMGQSPCGADATIFAWTAGLLCERFDTPIRAAGERRQNLVAYRDRLMQQYFPDYAQRR
jgi:glutathione S-transferase